MKIQIITLFPEMFDKVFNQSMLWKAQDRGLVEFETIDLRQFGLGPRHQVDDTPYGGGDGMLLKPEQRLFYLRLRVKFGIRLARRNLQNQAKTISLSVHITKVMMSEF